MDVVTLSQLQFAATGMFHWIFVPLTLGLSILTASGWDWPHSSVGFPGVSLLVAFWQAESSCEAGGDPMTDQAIQRAGMRNRLHRSSRRRKMVRSLGGTMTSPG